MFDLKNKDSLSNKILTALTLNICSTLISECVNLIKNSHNAKIDVGEWGAYGMFDKVNKVLYNINKDKYERHMQPTTDKQVLRLCDDVSYIIKLKNKNYIKISTYKIQTKNMYNNEQHLKLIFIGNEKYKNRTKFLKQVLKLGDSKKINISYLNDSNIKCDTVSKSFDSLVLDENVKNRIIDGLSGWRNSKDWYEKHELPYKIGVLLYGDNGNGKSSIAKCISNMFNNAPILAIDLSNVQQSISGIIRMRNKTDGTLIVLLEDFDFCFKNRESEENKEEKENNNQNLIFQLLDGVYSTDNTIFVATTNHKEKLDSALIRYGRFDIQEYIDYFDYDRALKNIKNFGYNKDVLDSFNLEFPVQPSYLQSKIIEYHSKNGDK